MNDWHTTSPLCTTISSPADRAAASPAMRRSKGVPRAAEGSRSQATPTCGKKIEFLIWSR